MTGFAQADTATLLAVRTNLLAGLDLVATALDDGTFHAAGPKGSASPAQAGQLTLALLDGVNAELATRRPMEQP